MGTKNGAKDKWVAVLGLLAFLGQMYVFIGVGSLLMKAYGADIAYIGFWHAPWRLVLSLFS